MVSVGTGMDIRIDVGALEGSQAGYTILKLLDFSREQHILKYTIHT